MIYTDLTWNRSAEFDNGIGVGYMYRLIKSCHRQHEMERKDYQISDKC